MNDGANVGFVDAQTERIGRDHDARVVAHKRQLRRVTLGFAHFAVVHADFQAQHRQRSGDRFDGTNRRAIDDHGTLNLANQAQQPFDLGFFVGCFADLEVQ